MSQQEIEIYYPESVAAWRNWLEANHQHQQAVWVVFYNKSSQKPSMTWSESVDVALCYGWIDSKKVKIDNESSQQYFSKRKPNSTWSKINKDKVESLMSANLMAPAGLKCIEIAKENGTWTLLDEVEALVFPTDLVEAMQSSQLAHAYIENLSKSNKKMLLHWLVMAKTQETRTKRLEEIISRAELGMKPKHMA